MSDELITQRIAQLSPAYRAFIESNFAEITCRSFGEANGFDVRKTEILENAFTFYLLFLFDEQMTTAFIARNCEMSSEEATLLFIAMRSTLPEGLDALVQAQANSLMPTSQTGLASEIAETEKVFENLQGIRTMAGDMREAQAQVPTYRSSQADIIRPTDSMPPPINSGPRWETDK